MSTSSYASAACIHIICGACLRTQMVLRILPFGPYLGKWHIIDQGGSGLCEVCHVFEVPSPGLGKLHEGPHIVCRSDDLHSAVQYGIIHSVPS